MMEQQENTRRHIFRVEDWECCKDKVFVEAVGIEMNKDLIQRIPHRIFGGDIACIYRIDLISQKSIRVMNEMLELWGITEDELNRTALGNTMKKYPAVLMPVVHRPGSMERSPMSSWAIKALVVPPASSR